MHDTQALTELERKIEYLLSAVTADEQRELAKLALLLHVTYTDSMSTTARHAFDDALRVIGQDYLLVFRAMRQTARHIIAKRKNWRSRA